MAATKLQMNWTTVAHGSNAITRVTAVSFSQGGSLIDFAGDTDRFTTVIVNNMNKPTASITSGDIAALMALVPGTAASLTATHKDAAKQTAGDIAYTLSNAVMENTTANGPFSQYGSATATFKAYSSDGSTNPLAFTRV